MRVFILLTVLLGWLQLSAGERPGMSVHPVGNTGCTFSTYCSPALVSVYTEDSSKVYSGECVYGPVSYGIICIKLRDTLTLPDVEVVMGKYLQYLKEEFKIDSYGQPEKGKTLPGNSHTTGIMDYWRHGDANNMKVKAWSDGKCIAVMYVSSQAEINEKQADTYLDGIVFPK